eukprot:352336-Chlamydomonas_euryale.AAC.2
MAQPSGATQHKGSSPTSSPQPVSPPAPHTCLPHRRSAPKQEDPLTTSNFLDSTLTASPAATGGRPRAPTAASPRLA